ncbi:TOBE domain-containing protein [Halorubrum sp. AD140]|uniref:TOBE domain-containing protein n=1 Tax=Halorubrum sp. AD140 TaxID=3050073 RepID=UPI002ACC8FA1|nr:TOBE domain-containing protein [Halorubrum sp. AD140]MDZ5811245.1 TOBE domain-containing protein [Halorubrum sp. AD140]
MDDPGDREARPTAEGGTGGDEERGGAAGRGRAALVEGDTEFDARDAALLRAVHEAGSVAGAASALGRSRARALSRIETLEDAFDLLVERRRGGSGGGGSRLTAAGRDLLDRYDRLQAVLAATASVPETVLDGTVARVDGELADVDTAVGRLRGLHGGTDGAGGADGVRGGVAVGDRVQVRIGADAVTVHTGDERVDPDATSARNRLRGTVAEIDAGETVSTVRVAVEGVTFRVLITAESAQRMDLAVGDDVSIRWKATATRLVGHATGSAA